MDKIPEVKKYNPIQDYDILLSLLKKNTEQMCLDYRNHNYKNDLEYKKGYSHIIPLINDEGIKIEVKQPNTHEFSIDFTFETTRDVYPLPSESFYTYNEYSIERAANDFMKYLKVVYENAL